MLYVEWIKCIFGVRYIIEMLIELYKMVFFIMYWGIVICFNGFFVVFLVMIILYDEEFFDGGYVNIILFDMNFVDIFCDWVIK